MTFPEPYGNATKTQINIVALIGTAVTISSPIAGVNRTVRINPATGLSIDLPPTLIQRDGKGNNYVRVESDFDISVAALTFVPGHTADGYLATPSSRLGTLSFFSTSRVGILSILSLNADTHVTINHSDSNGFLHPEKRHNRWVKVISVTLSSFEVYQVRCARYCRGYVNASSPIYVRYGSTIGQRTNLLPHSSVVDEAMLIHDILFTVILPRFADEGKQEWTCVYYSDVQKDNNKNSLSVSHNGLLYSVGLHYVDYPIVNNSGSCSLNGRGFTTFLPPIQSYTNFYRFITPSLPNFTHHAAIMIMSSEKDGIRLDYLEPIAREEIDPAAPKLYSILHLNVTYGQHDIMHIKPSVNFGVIIYGYRVGGTETYVYPAGMKLK